MRCDRIKSSRPKNLRTSVKLVRTITSPDLQTSRTKTIILNGLGDVADLARQLRYVEAAHVTLVALLLELALLLPRARPNPKNLKI
jgi:hypothetical protein